MPGDEFRDQNPSLWAHHLTLQRFEDQATSHFGPHVRRGLEASRSQRHHLSFVTRFAIMTRGNQRDKAREKNLKEQAAAVRASFTLDVPICAHIAIPVEEDSGAPSTFFFVHPGQNLPMCRGTQS